MKLAINAITMRPGGAFTVLAGLLKAWQTAGCRFEISILASSPATLQTLQDSNIAFQLVPVAVGENSFRRGWWQVRHLRHWLVKNRIDVLLTNNHYVLGVPCPQVVHHHNLWRFVGNRSDLPGPPRLGDRARDWSARQALRSAAANVFVSDTLRRLAESVVPASKERNHVIPNCLDDELLARAALPLAAPVQTDRLVSVQSANPHKDNATLLRTLAELVRRRPDVRWRLSLAGSPGRASWQPLMRLAAKLGIDERIDWLGFLSSLAVQRLEQASLCLIATSRLESSGLTLIEAMAAGSPVIASRIPAFVEYAASAAQLVEAGQPEAFAEATIALRENPMLRDEHIAAGKARVEEYRWSTWAPRFAEILQMAAQSGPASGC